MIKKKKPTYLIDEIRELKWIEFIMVWIRFMGHIILHTS